MKKFYLLLSIIIIGAGINIASTLVGVYSYHAVYMYNFIKYIQWPQGKLEGPFVIGILGDSPIMTELSQMATRKKVGIRNILVDEVTNDKQITTCNILFIPENNSKMAQAAIQSAKDKGVLVITESPGMSRKGAAINFIFVEGKLKFEINKSAANDARLNVSSELLKLGIPIE